MKMNLQNTKKRAAKSQSYMLALGLLAVSTISIPAFASNSSLTSPLTSAENVVALSNNSKAATASTDPTETRHESRPQYRSNYWFVGAEVMSPLTFGTLYSWTNEGNLHLGLGAQLSGGYQFTSVFGLQAAFGAGRSHAFSNNFQRNFYLGQHDAYTYYPYTMIDGTVYHFPTNSRDGKTLIG